MIQACPPRNCFFTLRRLNPRRRDHKCAIGHRLRLVSWERIGAGIPADGAALKQNGKACELFVYPDVSHAFNSDAGGERYDKAAADLAWGRRIAFLKRYLA